MLNMETWNRYEEMKEILGAEVLLEAIARSLGTYELKDHLKYIARCYDIDEQTEY